MPSWLDKCGFSHILPREVGGSGNGRAIAEKWRREMRNLRIKYQSPMYPNTTGTTQLIRKTLSQAVADAIREQILSGQVRMGTRLSQDALPSSLGVSRIPLREALRQLEADGFVLSYPHRRAFGLPSSL